MFNENSNRFVSCSDEKIIIWDSNGEKLKTIENN